MPQSILTCSLNKLAMWVVFVQKCRNSWRIPVDLFVKIPSQKIHDVKSATNMCQIYTFQIYSSNLYLLYTQETYIFYIHKQLISFIYSRNIFIPSEYSCNIYPLYRYLLYLSEVPIIKVYVPHSCVNLVPFRMSWGHICWHFWNVRSTVVSPQSPRITSVRWLLPSGEHEIFTSSQPPLIGLFSRMLFFSGGSDQWRDWTAGSSTPGSGGSQPASALRAAARHQRDLGKIRCQAWSKTGQLGFASHAVYFTCCFLSIIRCRCLEWGRLLATCPPSGEPGLTSAQSGSSRWPSTERKTTVSFVPGASLAGR